MTITLLFVIAIVALLTWLVPMTDLLRKLLYAVAIIFFIFWLIALLGVGLPSFRSLP